MLNNKKYRIPVMLSYYTYEEVEAINEDVAAETAIQHLENSEEFSFNGQVPEIKILWDKVEEI